IVYISNKSRRAYIFGKMTSSNPSKVETSCAIKMCLPFCPTTPRNSYSRQPAMAYIPWEEMEVYKLGKPKQATSWSAAKSTTAFICTKISMLWDHSGWCDYYQQKR